MAVVVISPVLVGIDVRMIFCLIFKWFTLFSCKLSRNKLVLIPLSTVLYLPLLFTSLLLTTDKFYFTFFLFAFHFNTLKHFFSFAIISCKQLLLLDSSHVTTTLLFCFCFFFFTICYYCRYKSVKISDCECFLFFFLYFVGVGVNVSCVVSSCYILFVSVLAGGCC